VAKDIAKAVEQAAKTSGHNITPTFMCNPPQGQGMEQMKVYDTAAAALKSMYPKTELDFEVTSSPTYLNSQIEKAVQKASQTR
jgi:hypothetical protein